MGAPTFPGPSSRASDEGAGWRSCAGPGVWKNDVPEGTKRTSWLRPSTLWKSRNDVIAKVFADPTSAARARWVELARQRTAAAGTSPDFVLSRPAGESFTVLVVGDTGEGDNSQYAVAHALTDQAETADFAVICSDVIYPAGDLGDYGPKFHRPYRNITLPIYAVPGNHDWYDGLHGFMHNFCRIDDRGYLASFGRGPAARIARQLWRKPPESDAPASSGPPGDDVPERPPPDPLQPAPYFAIDAGPVRFVGIDTGISGEIDAEQYEWLRRVSLGSPEQPKILITGKPIYVDNKYHPGRVTGTTQTVDDVVTDPRANFVMAIGGDIHNYQRYPVVVGGRTIQYVVSGGGGAFMHATHRIPPVDIHGVTEEAFRCYPLRRDSLARFSQVIDQRLFAGIGVLAIGPTAAARYYQDRGIVSAADRSAAERMSWRERIKTFLIHHIPAGRFFHRFGSEIFDFDNPPFFKQFLRLDVNSASVSVSCLGVTGCADTDDMPAVEDRFTVTW